MKSIEYKGFDIEIEQDQDAIDPQEDCDNDVFIVFEHRSFTVKVEGFDAQMIYEDYYQKGKKLCKGHWLFPLEAYIHSGVHLMVRGSIEAANCPDRRWDVSFGGFVLVKRQKGWSWTQELAATKCKGMVDDWNLYNSGEVYGYNIPDLNESCWGFYGDWEKNVLAEAKAIIDNHLKSKKDANHKDLQEV